MIGVEPVARLIGAQRRHYIGTPASGTARRLWGHAGSETGAPGAKAFAGGNV